MNDIKVVFAEAKVSGSDAEGLPRETATTYLLFTKNWVLPLCQEECSMSLLSVGYTVGYSASSQKP